jgi:hypothetical protein
MAGRAQRRRVYHPHPIPRRGFQMVLHYSYVASSASFCPVSPPGIVLFAAKKDEKPPAIPRCWTHGQRNVRVPLESSGRSVALRISLRLQGRTCEAILRVSPAMQNAPTRYALDFESATPRICNAYSLPWQGEVDCRRQDGEVFDRGSAARSPKASLV